MSFDFSDYACNHCGWCCERTPCPLGLFMGAKAGRTCQYYLKESETDRCGLLKDCDDPVKQAAAEEIIFSGSGCSHKFGPHPVSLIQQLLDQGLTKHSAQWNQAISATVSEYQHMAQSCETQSERADIEQAIIEFKQFCND